MKKKKLTKKLELNKENISSLNFDEMSKMKGAISLVFACTESCSVFVACCEPTTEKDNNNIDLEKGHG